MDFLRRGPHASLQWQQDQALRPQLRFRPRKLLLDDGFYALHTPSGARYKKYRLEFTGDLVDGGGVAQTCVRSEKLHSEFREDFKVASSQCLPSEPISLFPPLDEACFYQTGFGAEWIGSTYDETTGTPPTECVYDHDTTMTDGALTNILNYQCTEADHAMCDTCLAGRARGSLTAGVEPYFLHYPAHSRALTAFSTVEVQYASPLSENVGAVLHLSLVDEGTGQDVDASLSLPLESGKISLAEANPDLFVLPGQSYRLGGGGVDVSFEGCETTYVNDIPVRRTREVTITGLAIYP